MGLRGGKGPFFYFFMTLREAIETYSWFATSTKNGYSMAITAHASLSLTQMAGPIGLKLGLKLGFYQ